MSSISKQEYEVAKAKVAAYEALRRLSLNKDFKTLVLEGYLDLYLKEKTFKLSNTAEGSNEQNDLINSIKSVSFFRKYLDSIESDIHNVLTTIDYYESGISSIKEEVEY